jgi:FdhD protein
MLDPDPTVGHQAWRLRDGSLGPAEARVIVEEPLEIFVDGAPYVVLMRTPGDDRALAAGLCFSEGLVDRARDIGTIAACQDETANRVEVRRAGTRAAEGPPARTLPAAIASSCGLCGREMIDDLVRRLPRLTDRFPISTDNLLDLGRRMRDSQRHFQSTGGTHAAALFDRARQLLSFGEDVGRHNALDKAIGRLLLEDRLAEAAIAVLSGRCSFEMIQKAARAHIPIVASVSAPTHLAIAVAQRVGITLVGFLRGDSLTVYVDAGRIPNLPPTR